MELLPSILATEEAWGAVESIAVPPGYADGLVAELVDAGRTDLVPLVTYGEPGRLVVTIAGRNWPYGGL